MRFVLIMITLSNEQAALSSAEVRIEDLFAAVPPTPRSSVGMFNLIVHQAMLLRNARQAGRVTLAVHIQMLYHGLEDGQAMPTLSSRRILAQAFGSKISCNSCPASRLFVLSLPLAFAGVERCRAQPSMALRREHSVGCQLSGWNHPMGNCCGSFAIALLYQVNQDFVLNTREPTSSRTQLFKHREEGPMPMWSSDMLPRVAEPLHSPGGFDGLSKCYVMFVVSETAGCQQGHAVASLAHAVASLAHEGSTLPVVFFLGQKTAVK